MEALGVGVLGDPWKSLNVLGVLVLKFHWNSWKSSETHRSPGESLEVFVQPWLEVSLEVLGSPWRWKSLALEVLGS